MRRSAPTSVAIGTKLDVGASVTKNQTKQYAARGAATNQATEAAASAAMKTNCGHTSEKVSGRGHPQNATRRTGQNDSSRYSTMTPAWLSRYVHGEMPAENPLTADRGPDQRTAASTNHDPTSPMYSEPRSRQALRQLSTRNARS